MLTAAALCPAPPLLIPELTGAAEVAADLRSACLDAVSELAEGKPDVIVIVGGAGQTRRWPAGARLDLAVFAPGAAGPGAERGRRAGPGAADLGQEGPGAGTVGLPATVGVGGWLLDQAGYLGGRVLQAVGYGEAAAACARIGAELAREKERVGLLVMADGSTRRGLKAPGYLDDRSADFDAAVEQAVRDADLRALLGLDQELAGELMAAGRAAMQVLAGATPDGGNAAQQVSTEIRYSGDPFGVAYLVASVRVRE